MEIIDEKLCISQFLNGEQNNPIDKIVVQTVHFKGWGSIETEDVIQNTRLALLKNFNEGEYRGEGLKTYVQRIAEIQCLLELRRHYKEEKYVVKESEPMIEEPDPNPGPETDLIENERREKGIKILKSLDKLCRKLLFLRFYNDLSFSQIAQRLSISEVNARVSVHRCLKKSMEIALKMEKSL